MNPVNCLRFLSLVALLGLASGCAPSGPATPIPTLAGEPLPGSGGVLSSTGNCFYQAELAAEINYPPGSNVPLGATVVKTWQVRNAGTCSWSEQVSLRQVDGVGVRAAQEQLPLAITAPGAILEISTPVTLAPETALGQAEDAAFQLHTPDGIPFGPLLPLNVVASAALPAPESPIPTRDAACTYGSELVADLTVPDGTGIQVGTNFVKTWQIRNSGTCPWDNALRLAPIGGDLNLSAVGDVTIPNTLPGQVIEVTAELRLAQEAPLGSEQFMGFQLRAPDGTLFGATPYVLITAAESSEAGVVTPAAGSTSDCTYDSKYLVDVTIPDGMEMALGARLVKTWQIRNTGTCAWDSGVRIEQIAGTLLRADEIVSVPATAPNEVAEISVRVTLSLDAPLNTRQRATFQLRAPNGAYFGSKPYVEVVAVGSAGQ